MTSKTLYPHIPKSAIGRFDIKPLEILEKEYEEFIKPYWERIGEVLVRKETLRKAPFKESDRLYSAKGKREREIKRAKAYKVWREKQTIPQVKLVKLDHIWEKCPVCGCDVGSAWPPQPAIWAFDLKVTDHMVPLVLTFKCTECGVISADYNRYAYCRKEFYTRGTDCSPALLS